MISPPLQIFSKGSKLIFGVAGLLVVGLFGVPLSHAQTQADEARLAARVDGDGQLSPFLSFPGGTVALEDNAETSAEGSAVSTASALPPALVGLLANTTTVATPAMATPKVSATKPKFLARHVRFLAADSISQFRYMDRAAGEVTARNLYYKLSTQVQVSLLGEGVTYLQARGESGRSFTSSYDYTGVGLNDPYWSYNLKSFFLAQKLGRHLEAQAGGIEFDRGAGSEATYADNDGWLEGYRLRYMGNGEHNMPDKVSVTIGYVGDFVQPNFFSRLHRMADENNVQILAAKRLGKGVDASGEFDSMQGTRFSREAVHWQELRLILIDEFSAEAMIRASDNASFGWSSSLYRALLPKGRMRAGVFYSDMPKDIFVRGKRAVLLNGDSYALGKRVGPTLRIVAARNLEITLFGSACLDNSPGTRYRGQVAVRYQLAELLNRGLR